MPVTLRRGQVAAFNQYMVTLRDGARTAGATRLRVGSALPYASHWIEEGWRDDPRYGRIGITYRTPAYTNFIRQARDDNAPLLPKYIWQGLQAGSEAVRLEMLTFAQRVADSMVNNLDATVYSQPPPPDRGPSYVRSHDLANSIKVVEL